MKQYRLRLFHESKTGWTEWRNINTPFKDKDVLTVQFNEPLTYEESEAFFKNYLEKV